MFHWFRDLIVAVQGVAVGLVNLSESVDRTSSDHLAGRVEELERSRALWEGTIEGLVTKIDARFNAVRASEERVRVLTRKAKANDDEADESTTGDPDQFAELYRAYADAGAVRKLPAMRQDVEAPGRRKPKDRKWGRTA